MRALMATVLTVAMIASVPAAAQKVSRDYETDDLKQWDVVHCGGTGGNCPCTNISGGGAGSCSTATNTSTPPAGNRLVLDPANAIQGNYSLKVTVCDGDYWPNNSSSNTAQCTDASGNPTGNCTIRNELVTDGNHYFHPGDERWFFWYTRFGNSTTACSAMNACSNTDECFPRPPAGSGPGSNIFHVSTQLHHSGDNGSPPLEVGLAVDNTSEYQIALSSNQTDLNFNTGHQNWTAPIERGVWHSFALHVKFSSDPTVGFFELWHGTGGAPLAQQTLTCWGDLIGNPNNQPTQATTCHQRTMYNPCSNVFNASQDCDASGTEFVLMGQGLYHQQGVTLGKEVIWHDGTVVGNSSSDIVPPECCNGVACNALDACGLGATCNATNSLSCSGPPGVTVTKSGTGAGSVTSSPAGISCGATCSSSFPAGTVVTLTAAADSGSSFSGFTGGCTSGSTTCTFTVNASTTVNAAFARNDFSMTASPQSNSASPGGSANYAVSTALTSGAAQTVAFSVSGLPAGATASFTPASVSAGGGSTMNVAVGTSTPVGTYTLNVVGTGTSTTHNVNVTLSVSVPGTIAFRAQSTYTEISTSTMSIALTVPAAVQANDVLIANVFAGDYLGSSLPNVTAPQGWTFVKQVTHGTAGLLQIYSRVANATDHGTTYSWTTDIWVGAASSLVAYSGVNTASPVDASAIQDNPNAASSYSTPQVTTSAAGDLLVATYASYSQNGVSSWNAPAGMTQRVNVNNGHLLSISNDDTTQSGAGASGTFSSTATPSQTYALTALVALRPSSAPAPITFRAQSTYTEISTSTMSIDLIVPAAVQANDVLIANVFAGDYLGSSLPVVTAPQGWTFVKQVTHGTAGLLQIYSRVASATDHGTTYSWTTDIWVGAASSLVAYSGANAVTPVDASAIQDNPSAAATYSTPQVTTSAAGDLLVATYASYSQNGVSSWNAPAGMTQRVNVNNGHLLSISNDDKIQAAAGASGTFSSTATPSQTYALTALVALKP